MPEVLVLQEQTLMNQEDSGLASWTPSFSFLNTSSVFAIPQRSPTLPKDAGSVHMGCTSQPGQHLELSGVSPSGSTMVPSCSKARSHGLPDPLFALVLLPSIGLLQTLKLIMELISSAPAGKDTDR